MISKYSNSTIAKCDEAGLRQQYTYRNWIANVDLQYDILLWEVGQPVIYSAAWSTDTLTLLNSAY